MQLKISRILQTDNFTKKQKEDALFLKIEIAECLYQKGRYKETSEWLSNLDQLLSNSDFPTFNTELFQLLILKGKVSEKLKYWAEVSEIYKKALVIADRYPDIIEKEEMANVYFRIGRANIVLNDYLFAIDYLNKALAICSNQGACSISTQANIYADMGRCYMFLGKKNISEIHFEKAVSLFQKLPVSVRKREIITTLKKKGIMYNYFNEYEKAVQCFKYVIKLCSEVYGDNNKETANCIDLLGNAYYYLKDYPKAIIEFKRAVEIFNTIHAQKTASAADKYSKIAACYTNMKKFGIADTYMDKCFNVLEFNQGLNHPFEEYKSSHTHLLITLYFKAKNHQKAYEAGWGMDRLYKAAHWFDLCIELIEYIYGTFEESGSKQYLLDRFYYIFEAAINCNYDLHEETDSLQYLAQAFGYAERSKALLLKEAMQMADASFEAGIPESLLAEERRLKKAIIGKENRRYELAQQQEGQPAVHELNSEIFNLKREYHQVMDSIQQQYPRGHQFRYASAPLAPGQIQAELLAPGQALLQYFLGEEYLFLFVISREKAYLARLKAEEGLAESVHRFRESIYGWSQSREDSLAREYAGYGYQLYQSLVQPVADMLPEQLIIIPDGILEYVPFEALLKESVSPEAQPYGSYPYLIRDYQVSYAHSARLLQEMKAAAHRAPRQWILAFAPSFQDQPEQENSLASRRRNLGRLTGNVKEVQSLKSLLRTRIYKGTDATRERFLADAPYYSIIHLATHAKANDEEGEYSYLAFTEVPDTIQNELLYAKDLYSLRLQADMVVLSACESGVGELRRGEGVISLARGFSYAGAKSLVTTLWRVSDRESAALMKYFYQHLKDGQPKDEALRAAKMAFISQPGGGRAHPFFWAAFTLIGDMAPVDVSGQIFPGWVFVLLISLFVFLLSHFAKKRPS